jgi:hypothetical protein
MDIGSVQPDRQQGVAWLAQLCTAWCKKHVYAWLWTSVQHMDQVAVVCTAVCKCRSSDTPAPILAAGPPTCKDEISI